jgi:hypothetical protein
VNTTVCRALVFQSQFAGAVPFELREVRPAPEGHQLEVRLPGGNLLPGRNAVTASSGDRFRVCLSTLRSARSSVASGERWLELHVAGSSAVEHVVPIQLHWQVRGLTFWQRWGSLIAGILAALLVLFIITGYLLPNRFQRGLAIVFVPDRAELDEQLPQPVKQWRGVGIGFYRHARAYLHADYRLSSRAQGALASLHAEKGSTRLMPGRGLSLFRETVAADWESVPAQGRRARGGEIYRIGDRGPYLRIATRGMA